MKLFSKLMNTCLQRTEKLLKLFYPRSRYKSHEIKARISKSPRDY